MKGEEGCKGGPCLCCGNSTHGYKLTRPAPRRVVNEKHAFTVFGKHCECMTQKCTHLGRFPPLVSHLLVLRHCVLTWYGGQKKSHHEHFAEPGFESKSIRSQVHVSTTCAVTTIVLDGPYCFLTETPINLNFKSHFFVENGKFQLMPKIMNHLFTYYLNCAGKSDPVCLIQQLPLFILLASYVQ